jgi:predicted CXXCH cytochrome family protein
MPLKPGTLAVLAVALAAPSAATAAPEGGEKARSVPAWAGRPNPGKKTVNIKVSPAPLPPTEKAGWKHSPYAAGDCAICHEKNDKKAPGKVVVAGNELCYGCHEEFAIIMRAKHKHAPATSNCLACHNPHDSKQRKLLNDDIYAQCVSCHVGIREVADAATAKHDALTQGNKCLNCHNPHASNVEKLLTALPYDQCVNCHSNDTLKDDKGVPMTNFKKLLAENKVLHAPIAAKDCSACHAVHGGENFRMLVADYPARFYAPYDLKNYELCYGCHNDKVVSEQETTTLTNFRDGSRNLHYVHVNKPDRGRTCRACHEVHASQQPHQIRDSVPYGPRGWLLKVGYEQTPTGGSCARTCHDTKTYTNRTLSSQPAKKK